MLIVITMIKQEGCFELTSQSFVGHVNLSFANSQATSFRIFVGDFVRNPEIKSLEVLQQYTIAPWEQVICAGA